MSSADEILNRLQAAAEEGVDEWDEPEELMRSELASLPVASLPEGLELQVLDRVDTKGIRYISLDGTFRREGTSLLATVRETGWRKGWLGPLGVDDYHALVLAAVEARTAARGDVTVVEIVEDNVHGVIYEVTLPGSGTLRDGYERALAVRSEINEAAEAVSAGVVDLVERTRKRLGGWGTQPLDSLIDRVGKQSGTPNERGLLLEELTTRLFDTVPGFQATGRINTTTEEIDIRIQNSSEAARWKRETYMLLAECKNWSGKCGKNEFVAFRSKLANRFGRVGCGFLISWNGFAETLTQEMLRGSTESLVIVALTGLDLREAVLKGNFAEVLERRYEESIFT